MRRTTVYLPEELKAALERAAAGAGRSEAELVREGVSHVTRGFEHPRPKLPLIESGDPTLAERADDLLLAARVGREAQRALLGEVARGAYALAPFDAADVQRAGEIVDRYADLDVGLADASIVVLAKRHDVREVLTLDERHFRTLRAPRGRPFRLLPAGA